MPALPELCNILTEEWMPEVFIKMESKYTADSDCHIGITGKVKVNLHGVQDDTVPSTQCGLVADDIIAEKLCHNIA